MTRRTRILIAGGLLLAILIVLSLFLWFFFKPDSSQRESRGSETSSVPLVASEPLENAIEQEQKIERAQGSDIIAFSKTFVERYGSYSTEAQFANLTDVLPLLSERFGSEVEQTVDQAEPTFGYYGVSTQVITVEIDEVDEAAGVAVVVVNTQRAESIDSPQNLVIRYQEIRLTFVKEAGTWKIDSASWL